MTFLDAAILGVIEGLSEFLPISSTGHLILASNLLGISSDAFTKTFEIAIQLGAILSVIVLYGRSRFLNPEILKRLAVAFIPTGIIGFFFYKIVKQLLGSPLVVVIALFVGGAILILFERWHKEKEDVTHDLASMPYGMAVKLGLFQAISIIPGISRSGATILGGLFLGMKRGAIVEFSFLLAVPTMIAATAYDLMKNAGSFRDAEWHLLAVGSVVSFAVAIGAIKFLLRFVKTNTFVSFGVYRMIVAALFFLFML
jgi:undecaprenyl-diphosphatase